MRHRWLILAAVAGLLWLSAACRAGQGAAPTRLRVATWNIQNFDAQATPQRIANVRAVIDRLDADLIGLQEIENRVMLDQVFDRRQWSLVIDDQADRLNPALAVRRPLEVRGLAAPHDAGDEQFWFEEPASEPFFPYGRNLLAVTVGVPGGGEVTVLVHHAKSRGGGGRHQTDWQRCGAAAQIVAYLQGPAAGGEVILLGDFNDNPDDQSLNILETGDWRAGAGPEPGVETRLLVNLAEPLLAEDRCTWGILEMSASGGRVRTTVRGSRERNNAERWSSGRPGAILFDQILVSPSLAPRVIRGSVRIFDEALAVDGDDATRASDHLPMLCDLSAAD